MFTFCDFLKTLVPESFPCLTQRNPPVSIRKVSLISWLKRISFPPSHSSWRRAKPIHCNCTATAATALQLHCTATALQLHCKCTATALLLHCNCTATALQLHCYCTATALQLHCNCTANALEMQRKCNVNVLQINCNCTATALRCRDAKSFPRPTKKLNADGRLTSQESQQVQRCNARCTNSKRYLTSDRYPFHAFARQKKIFQCSFILASKIIFPKHGC